MEEAKPANNNGRRKKVAAFVFLALAIVGGVIGFLYYQYKQTHITTDDAFIDGHIYTISSRVSGTVKNIYVDDNISVKKGQTLLTLDPADYKAKVDKAKAALELARNQLDQQDVFVKNVKARLESLRYRLNQAEIDLRRAQNLYMEEAIPKERYDKVLTERDVIASQAKAAKEEVRQAEVALSKAAIRLRAAELKEAELNESYTVVSSPSDGYITKKSVEVGNQIQAGQPLMAVVPLNEIWVTANYKETQLEKVRPGQTVDIEVDTYPDRRFKGKVDSIMAGTGSEFSIFPPENATGNYVKVVQRIPVKIIITGGIDKEHPLRLGMSVVLTIKVGPQ